MGLLDKVVLVAWMLGAPAMLALGVAGLLWMHWEGGDDDERDSDGRP